MRIKESELKTAIQKYTGLIAEDREKEIFGLPDNYSYEKDPVALDRAFKKLVSSGFHPDLYTQKEKSETATAVFKLLTLAKEYLQKPEMKKRQKETVNGVYREEPSGLFRKPIVPEKFASIVDMINKPERLTLDVILNIDSVINEVILTEKQLESKMPLVELDPDSIFETRAKINEWGQDRRMEFGSTLADQKTLAEREFVRKNKETAMKKWLGKSLSFNGRINWKKAVSRFKVRAVKKHNHPHIPIWVSKIKKGIKSHKREIALSLGLLAGILLGKYVWDHRKGAYVQTKLSGFIGYKR